MRATAAFLTRLRRDVRGNVLALTAASLIPLIGLVGGGIDLSRLYLSKVRLQHACDAGALAGRKAMGAGTWAQASPSPSNTADQFFAGNFKTGSYATTALTHSYSESAGKVSGSASVTVPMTMMSFFGMTPQTLSVNCSAQMQIPNTDVMFVLDNTGSMADCPDGSHCNSGSGSKIATLKYAVKCFYESVTQLTTNAGCPAGTSSGSGINNSAQIRFGFVPYTTNVNVGRLLPSTWFASSWPYQSRYSRVWVRQSTPTSSTRTVGSQPTQQSQCNQQTLDQYGSQVGYTRPSNSDVKSDGDNNGSIRTVKQYTNSFDYTNGVCTVYETTTTTTYVMTENVVAGTNDMFLQWRYNKLSHDISGLKNGNGWNTSFTLPLGAGGTAKTITWDGCIEERQTAYHASYDPIPSDTQDLDIDTAPNSTTPGSYWGPALPGVVYPRQPTKNSSGVYNSSTTAWAMAEVLTGDDYPDAVASTAVGYYCPTVAKKLQTWSTASTFSSYVDSFYASGNTYHDIGMLWGGRLMSPTGLFASENGTTPTGGTIQRYMIFMTDGDTSTNPTDYAAYGLPWFDRRQESSQSNIPTGGSDSTPPPGSMTQQVNARFAALCTAVKNKGINLYVISFGGSGIAATTKTRLQTCATDTNHYYDATSADQLKAAFVSIAAQITQLRLVQ